MNKPAPTKSTLLAAAGAAFLLCNNSVEVVNGFGPLVSPHDTAKKIRSQLPPSSSSSARIGTPRSRKRSQQKPSSSLLLLHALSTDEDTLSAAAEAAAAVKNGTSMSPSFTSSDDDGPVPSKMRTETLELSLQRPSIMIVDSGNEEERMVATTSSSSTEEASSSSSAETPSSSMAASFGWRAVIVALCALWASNFAVAKVVMGVDGVDSSLYALSRFSVAAFALAPFALRGWKNANMDGETLRTSIVCGSWVAFGYLGQTRECSCLFLFFSLMLQQ